MISPPTLSFKPRSGEGSGGGQPNNPLASSASVSSIVESRLEAGRPEEHRNPINNLMQGKSIDVLAAVREREPERTKAFDSVFEVELGTRIVRSEPTAKQLVLGLQLIERGLAEFPNDSLVLLMAVTYLTAYYGEKGAHAADLLVRDLQISMRTAPMWIKYVVYAYDRSTRERGESALERALIESLWSVATKSHVRALKSTGLIWQAIFSGATAQTLGKLIRQMAGAQQIAMHNYQRLLAKCPRDQHVLRAFAQFLVSVEGNSMQANQLLSLADEFEVRDVQTFGKERNDDEDDNESGSDDSLGQVSDDSSDENDNKQDKADKEESPLAAKAQFLELGEATAIIKRSTQLHPSGGYGGSQVSGTSVVEKHVMFIRRVLLQRITQPLTMRYYLAFGWLLVLFVVCIGFRSCLQFFSNAAASQRKLFTSIAVRQQALATIENIRLMVQAPQDPLGSIVYPSVWSRLSANTTGLTLSIDQVTSWAVQSKQIWKTFRVYQPVTLPAISPARFDYAALYITPLAAAELVILAAKLALKFDGSTPASTLTTASMMANTELRILVDNFIMIQAAISEMLNTYMTEFMSFFATNNQFMWAYIAIGFVIFNIAGLLVAHFIVRPYLENEMEVVRILLRIPRKIVESLVTQTTESLECFREVTGAGENDENENAEDAIAATTSLSSSASTQAQILGKSSGSLQYYVSILLAALALSSIVGGMFGSTVGMASSSDYARVTYVSNRFYANSQWRLCSREYFYSDGTFTSDWAIQTCRSVAMDYRANHALAQVVSSGMAIDFPANTVEARDCENGCHIAEDPTIGFTLAVARQSLNAEINRLSAVADVVVSGMALGASPTDPTQQAQRQFRLSLALSNDLEGRMDDLIAAMDKQLATAILTATNLCVAMFVLAVLVLVLMMVALYKLALQHMFTTGHTLASLLTLIPYHHYHALPDLLAYLTACGIQVETGSAAAAANAAARAAAATAAASATAAGIAQRGLVVPEKDAFMLLGIDRHSTRGSKAGSPGNNRSNMGGSALAVPAAETSHPVSPTSLHSAMANTSGLGLPSRSGSKMVMVKSASALYRE
ncbi:hypothetical protein BC828DRAFT_377157 [Blastocladiella britannica]|nr:hypothetical protein BC828DRAFT_377157 [Blastocladiella britannica]